ncbi:hypothetical protein AGMMS49921_06830 [Endomicrobiia bacterium]|nr:hypothetical protein AGMMS49921_06830 [Endomicrobiia bacterium]
MQRKIKATISKSNSFVAREFAKEFDPNTKDKKIEIPNKTVVNAIVTNRASNTFLKFLK